MQGQKGLEYLIPIVRNWDTRGSPLYASSRGEDGVIEETRLTPNWS